MTHSVPYITTRAPLSRRHFLRGLGVALSLPFLDSMLPVFSRASDSTHPLDPNAKPRRMFAICNNLGLLPDQFFPVGEGRDYKVSPYLSHLQDHRNLRECLIQMWTAAILQMFVF